MDKNKSDNPIKGGLERQGLLILDGGLATELERRGADLSHELWSARMLVEDPQLIRDVHLDFLRAGADVIVTASYQASLAGFERAGLTAPNAIGAVQLSVKLAIEAREAFLTEPEARGRLRPLVAASIGPYGACLMDGSEYTGNYDLSERQLIDFHRPRMEILAESDADLFAIETIPSRREFEALLRLLEDFENRQAWFSFSCRDETRISHGETLAECAALAGGHPQVVAIGVNCTDPALVPELLRRIGNCGKPLIAYPNSGENWDPKTGLWYGDGTTQLEASAWVEAGARLVGGCCRVYPEQIAAMRHSLLDGGA